MVTTKGTAHSRRPYHSPARQRQAEETRQRILTAARDLFRSAGYARTTVERIAEDAGVSPKTVSAAYGSKVGILGALVLPTSGQGQDAIERVRAAPNAQRRIELVADLCGTIYGELMPEFELLRGAAMVAPELDQLARHIEERRRANGALLIAYLVEHSALRQDVDAEEASDILWMLTAYDLYRALVVARTWPVARYVAWLSRQLAHELLRNADTQAPSA